MQFGFLSLGENRFPDVDRDDHTYFHEYLMLAELLDELEYSSLWTGEHHFEHIAVVSSPVTLLSAIAARTSKIRLATGVNVMSFHHPIRLAEDYATLDILSNGRAMLGAGTGYAKGEFNGFGLDVADARTRFYEMVAIADKALNTGRFGFEGEHYQVPDVPLVPRPVQHPFPICIAVLGSWSTVEWTAAHGYDLVTSSQSQALTGSNLPQTVQHFRSVAAANGHGRRRISVPFFMLCSEDDAEIEAEFTHMVNYWKHLSLSLDRGLPDDLKYWESLKDKFEQLTVEDLHNRQTAFGRPEMLTELFLQIAASGVDEVLVEPFYGPQQYKDCARNLQLFRDKVMPYVDDRFGGPKYDWDGRETVLVHEATNTWPPG
jgi:alkanesulfonate monooxygenase SsuD/methylene tetrahydromethanopterin reductase-like flavin-dependent oxidoreductase (luciferase family)